MQTHQFKQETIPQTIPSLDKSNSYFKANRLMVHDLLVLDLETKWLYSFRILICYCNHLLKSCKLLKINSLSLSE